MSSYMPTLCEVSSDNSLIINSTITIDLNITICVVVHGKHNLEHNHVKHQHNQHWLPTIFRDEHM